MINPEKISKIKHNQTTIYEKYFFVSILTHFCKTLRLIKTQNAFIAVLCCILQVNPLGVCFYEHTCYYINATIWNGPPELTVPIYGYIMPIVLAVTFICNALIIIVLSKKHMRTPTNLVLLAMAVSDLLTIVCPAPWYVYFARRARARTLN